MKAGSQDSGNDVNSRELRLDRLLGRRVIAANRQAVGRLEEFRAEKRGNGYVITEFVIGAGGLIERLHVGVRSLFGLRGGGFVAGWDQLDLSDPDHPRLTCPVEALRKL